jgi:NTP pyrophosphatase (non-canonical NTP hydrolase)
VDIKVWQTKIHQWAIDKGWYDTERPTPELLCLLHSEVSEALEAYREHKDDLFREELADLAIRLLDACAYWGIDLEKEIERKHEININRLVGLGVVVLVLAIDRGPRNDQSGPGGSGAAG